MKSQTIKSSRPRGFNKAGWSIMMFLVVLLLFFSGKYLIMNPDVYFEQQKLVYMAHTTALMTHILGAMLVITIGPFLFLPRMRTARFLKLHRWLGRIYMLGILFGGLAGLYMAQFAYGGIISRLGFGALGCLWLYTGYRAYRHIRDKEIELHRQWMIRNYALSFAGVMLRLWTPTSDALGIDFLMAYRTIAWLCWVPNLLVAEWMIRRSRRSQPRARIAERPGNLVGPRKTAQTDF